VLFILLRLNDQALRLIVRVYKAAKQTKRNSLTH